MSLDDNWDQAYLDAGYIWCRPCREWQRSPECAIDEAGYALAWCGCRWADLETDEHRCGQ